MFHFVKTFLLHYASATLIDVLHSPFVFGLYNSCFAKNSFVKLPPSFSPQGKHYFDKRVDAIIAKLQLHFTQHKFYKDSTPKIKDEPIIWEISNSVIFDDTKKWITNAHNDSIILIRNPHQIVATKSIWQQLISNPKTTAIIDLYFLGIVFIRKEQNKQVIKLRLL